MKTIKRVVLICLSSIFLFIGLTALIFGGSDTGAYAGSAGSIQLSAKTFIDKTGFQIPEEHANNALEFGRRLMSRHNLTLPQASGVLAVAYRESRFDVTAVNPGGGVAGFFQWSGWSNTINGDRWAQASKRELTLAVQLDLMSTELDGPYKLVLEKMQGVTDPYEAAKVWSYYYEGVELSDAQSALGDVEKWSKTIYDALKTGFAPPNGKYGHLFNEPYTITQAYGYNAFAAVTYRGGRHTGLDLVTVNSSAGRDVPVFSMTNGVVKTVSSEPGGFGNFVTIQPDFGGYLIYAHLKYSSNLRVGDTVRMGDQIGILGSTGLSTGDHVHLQYSPTNEFSNDQDPSFLLVPSGALTEKVVFTP